MCSLLGRLHGLIQPGTPRRLQIAAAGRRLRSDAFAVRSGMQTAAGPIRCDGNPAGKLLPIPRASSCRVAARRCSDGLLQDARSCSIPLLQHAGTTTAAWRNSCSELCALLERLAEGYLTLSQTIQCNQSQATKLRLVRLSAFPRSQLRCSVLL